MSTVSKYWEHLNLKGSELLDEYGYDNFKQTIGRVYNDNSEEDVIVEMIQTLWNSLYTTVPKELLDKFSEPEIGNPITAECNVKLVTIDLGVSIRDYHILSKHIDFSSIDKIVEIGGGYGRFTYVIETLHPHIEYTMCDIEPTLGLAKWYLPQVLPKVDIQYVHPEDLYGKTNLVIASNCLHEMTRKQVHDYFNYADQNSDYFYYNCWRDTTIPGDYIRWEQADYPVKNRWEKVFERDYIRKDYFEALYKMGGKCQK